MTARKPFLWHRPSGEKRTICQTGWKRSGKKEWKFRRIRRQILRMENPFSASQPEECRGTFCPGERVRDRKERDRFCTLQPETGATLKGKISHVWNSRPLYGHITTNARAASYRKRHTSIRRAQRGGGGDGGMQVAYSWALPRKQNTPGWEKIMRERWGGGRLISAVYFFRYWFGRGSGLHCSTLCLLLEPGCDSQQSPNDLIHSSNPQHDVLWTSEAQGCARSPKLEKGPRSIGSDNSTCPSLRTYEHLRLYPPP